MADGIDIDAEGIGELEAKLEKLAELMLDLRPFWPLVVPLYTRWVGAQFDSGGSYFGEAWQELSPAYAAWKTVNYPGRGILMAEGDLRHAAQTPRREATPHMLVLTIEPFTKARGPGAGREIDPDWFQSGTDRMPARPLLPLAGELAPTQGAEIAEAAELYVADTARRLGL